MPKKSGFQIISGTQDQVQTHLDQMAGQNWRPILMTATSTPAGITLFVMLESTVSDSVQFTSEHDI